MILDIWFLMLILASTVGAAVMAAVFVFLLSPKIEKFLTHSTLIIQLIAFIHRIEKAKSDL